MRHLIQALVTLFHKPLLMIVLCFGCAFSTLLMEGSLFQLWSLKSEKRDMSDRIIHLRGENQILSMKVQQAKKNDRFLEKEAKERLDLLKKDELVFIFGDASQ